MNTPWGDVEQRFPWECRTWHDHESVVPWLKTNIGEFDQDWYRLGSDIANGVLDTQMLDLYRFGTERDAILFQLKWS